MRKFISLPWKVIALTLTAMLVIAVTITAFSTMQIQQEFEQRQSEKRTTAEMFYAHLRKVSNDKRILWLKTLSSQYLLRKSDYQAFDKAVQRQFDLDELRIDSVWIFDRLGNQAYTSGVEANDKIHLISQQVLNSQASQDLIYCEPDTNDCFHIVAMPILVGAKETSVLICRSNLSDLLYIMLELNKQTQLAIVHLNIEAKPLQTDLSSLTILTMSDAQQTKVIINSLPQITTLANLKQHVVTDYDEQYFSTSLLELQPGVSDGNYLMLMEDITQYHQTSLSYKKSVIIIATVIFFLIALAVFYISRRSSKRLLKLADNLPLLAEKRFDEFRQSKPSFTGITRDELDVLNLSSFQLADQLERLQIKIECKTQQLEQMAMYDQLTGLSSRNMLNFQIDKGLNNLSRQQDYMALLFLDLDDFKKVNDSHGHHVGDVLLKKAAQRIKSLVRSSDIVFRFGGDEFVILLNNIKQPIDIEDFATKVLQAFRRPILCEGLCFHVSASIGGTLAQDNAITSGELISQADMAMYQAKENGGNSFQLYDSSMYQRVANKVLLQAEVIEAIADGQFSLSLQPQIEIADGKLLGFEALLRWNHPLRGMVPPNEFIPALEDSEQFIELGYWVIRHSIELLSQLNNNGYKDIRIAINLSAAQFVDPKLFDYLVKQLEHFGVSGHSIELELTERTLVLDMDKTLDIMHRLRLLGFTFSIDDFGTGYSSLSYLKKMPIDCVKIDKCFIDGMVEHETDMQIVMSTIAMVHNLDMKVIAEGVEGRSQYQILKNLNCDAIQGYLFSRPIPESDLCQQLNSLVANNLWTGAVELHFDKV